MDFLTKVFAAMLGRFLGDELRGWLPFLTERLINLAVRRLPQQLRERYAEEWRAHIAEIPGEIGKLFCAAGFLWAGLLIWKGLRVDRLRSFVNEFPGVSRLVLQTSLSLALTLASYQPARKMRGEGNLSLATVLVTIPVAFLFSLITLHPRFRNLLSKTRDRFHLAGKGPGVSKMILQRMSIHGNAGRHTDHSGKECPGRSFDVLYVGSGGVHAKQVSCTVCRREFMAWEDGLGAEPAYPSRLKNNRGGSF